MNNSWDKIGQLILVIWFLDFLVYIKYLFTNEEIPEKTKLIGKTIMSIFVCSLIISLIAIYL